jgi:hypothetical protein
MALVRGRIAVARVVIEVANDPDAARHFADLCSELGHPAAPANGSTLDRLLSDEGGSATRYIFAKAGVPRRRVELAPGVELGRRYLPKRVGKWTAQDPEAREPYIPEPPRLAAPWVRCVASIVDADRAYDLAVASQDA